MIKILHTADNHLDPSQPMYKTKLEQRRKDFWESFKEVLKYAEKHKPDIFLISGDLYDRVNPRNPPRALLIRGFRHLYSLGIKIFIIGGQHDTPRSVEEGASPIDVIAQTGYIYFLNTIKNPSVEHIKINDIDVCISGLTYNHSLTEKDDPLQGVKVPVEGDINILMLHYSIEGFIPTYTYSEPVVRLVNIPKEIDYVAAGHLHLHQEKKRGNTLIAYPGSTERKSFIEEKDDAKGFLWIEYDSDKVSRKEFIPVHARRMKTVDVLLNEKLKNPNKEIINKALEYRDKELILRIRIKGRLPLDLLTRYRRDEILRKLLDNFFIVVLDDRELRYKLEHVSIGSEFSPIKSFRKYLEEKINNTKDERRQKILQKALEIGLTKLEEAGAW